MRFCHLHVHNEYSVLDGYGTAEQYAERASKLGMKYIGLSNHGNIDGLLQWQDACKKFGVKPVFGCELYIVKNAKVKEKEEKRRHVTVFIKNRKGFRNLCRILTYANLDGFYYRPRVDWPFLYKHLSGLVLLTGCIDSPLQDRKTAPKILERLDSYLGDDLYFEVMPHRIKGQIKLNKYILKLRREYSHKLVATNDCHYIKPSDCKVQEVLLAIQTKALWKDPDRFKFPINNLHLRSKKQMQEAFKRQGILTNGQIKSAIANTLEIGEKCSNFTIKNHAIVLPETKVPKKLSEKDYLWKMCLEGLKAKKLKKKADRILYRKRLEEEFNLIVKKDFVRYFLIVKDLVDYCRKQDIMVGPGRGSVGGSLIADLIGITIGVDPIKYGLIFSRFIAEDRNDYPDIDLDFEDIKRDQVRAYLEETYGLNNVAGITTALRMKAKNALRDAARVFQVPIPEVNAVSKAMDKLGYGPSNDGFDLIDNALNKRRVDEAVDTLKRFNSQYKSIVDYARALDKQVRGHGQHAAAIILSPVDLTKGDRGNLVVRKKNLLINWDMVEAEKLGFLKIDILGLNTLTILNGVKKLLKGKLRFRDIDLEDKEVFEMINRGSTTGLFQIGTKFSTGICREIEIDNFSNLCDAVALSRPGPYDSGMTANYIERKHSGHWRKKNKIYEKITKDTYGVIVYQEQVMAAIVELAGMSYSDSDKIRKVIGKKRDIKYFAPYKEGFIKGCLKRKTMTRSEAETFWVGLEKHAHYSFNKSHSVEYAIIAMWTAYCKYYHPAEFIASCLTYMPDDKDDQKTALIELARRLGYKVILPKISRSHSSKWVVEDKKLYCPFIAIKGIGKKKAEKIKSTKKVQVGFFDLEEDFEPQTQIEKLVYAVGGYSEDETYPEDAQDYFSFNIFGEDIPF